MTAITLTAMRPFYGQLSIARLSKIVRLLVVVEKAAFTAAILSGLLIVIQLLYPHNRTLPLQSVAGHNAGFKTTDKIASDLSGYANSKLTVSINGKSYDTSSKEAGISINNEVLSRQLRSYSWSQRLIPGSIFHKTRLESIPTVVDHSRQQPLIEKLSAASLVAPKNAGLIRNPDGKYTLWPQVTGVSASKEDVAKTLKSLDPIDKKSGVVPTSKQLPAITNQMLDSTIKQYDKTRKSPLHLSYNSKVYTIAPEQITAWSSIVIDETAKTATVTYDQAAMRAWLATSVPLVIQSPGVTTITIVNGVAQPHGNAPAGSGIDLDGTVASIVTALKNSQADISANTKSLAPVEQYVRQYTPTNEGLTAIINDWAKDRPGLKAGVALREIGGAGRQANLNGGSQYPMASIYKLFVDWYIFSQAEKGSLSLDSPSGVGGKSILQCIEASIVTSDNPCGKWLGDRAGWNNVTNFARGAGYGGTDLNNIVSTPLDTANLLLNLTSGGLINSGNTQTMLGYMQRQIYRSGIPAGSAGATVQDKVGFLGSTWNDAAIVRGPKSSYVLVIYTNGKDAGAIKDLANRIYNLMQT